MWITLPRRFAIRIHRSGARAAFAENISTAYRRPRRSDTSGRRARGEWLVLLYCNRVETTIFIYIIHRKHLIYYIGSRNFFDVSYWAGKYKFEMSFSDIFIRHTMGPGESWNTRHAIISVQPWRRNFSLRETAKWIVLNNNSEWTASDNSVQNQFTPNANIKKRISNWKRNWFLVVASVGRYWAYRNIGYRFLFIFFFVFLRNRYIWREKTSDNVPGICQKIKIAFSTDTTVNFSIGSRFIYFKHRNIE